MGSFYQIQKKIANFKMSTHKEENIIDRVIKYYGMKDPHWLSQLTHMESPWKTARACSAFSDDDRSSEEITPQSMFEYYSSL